MKLHLDSSLSRTSLRMALGMYRVLTLGVELSFEMALSPSRLPAPFSDWVGSARLSDLGRAVFKYRFISSLNISSTDAPEPNLFERAALTSSNF